MPSAAEGHFHQFQMQVFLTHLQQVPFLVVGVMLTSLVGAWLMLGQVDTAVVLVWLAVCWTLPFVRMGFARYMVPIVAAGRGFRLLQAGFAGTALLSGLTWGVFSVLLFDGEQPVTLFIIGVTLAGLTGGVVTSLSMFLPAFYLFTLAACLPFVYLLFAAENPEFAKAGILCFIFLAANLGYAHVLYRMQKETVYLRFQNRHLLQDLELRKTRAEEASQAKSLFLAGISHDLKQPLRAIAMYTAYLRHGAAGDAVPQTAGKIDLAVGAIHRQVSRLLELARLESGEMALEPKPVQLEAVFTQLEQLFGTQAQAKGIRLYFAPVRARRVAGVVADPRMLGSILENLVSNAVKHTEHGAVYVGTRVRTRYPAGQQVCVEVRDSGVGIAPANIPHLFDAYRSFDDRASSESHGLGLAIAKAQAGYLGCEITVVSRPGGGSTFTLCGLGAVPDGHPAAA